jgi:hypothetical protein
MTKEIPMPNDQWENGWEMVGREAPFGDLTFVID